MWFIAAEYTGRFTGTFGSSFSLQPSSQWPFRLPSNIGLGSGLAIYAVLPGVYPFSSHFSKWPSIHFLDLSQHP